MNGTARRFTLPVGMHALAIGGVLAGQSGVTFVREPYLQRVSAAEAAGMSCDQRQLPEPAIRTLKFLRTLPRLAAAS